VVNQVGVDESTTLVVAGAGHERFSAITVEPPLGRLPKQVQGRDDLLETLRAAADISEQCIHVLAGMGGIGKTAVALAVAKWAQREERHVWWVRGHPLGLPSDLLEVARELGARPYELEEARSGRRSAPDLVWGYLDHAERGWVLVIDSADEPDALAAEGRLLREGGGWIRPDARGLVLVTSRHAASETWEPGAHVHLVRALTEADGAAMLLGLAPEAGTIAEACDLAGRLGGIPLALHLAGRYLAWPLASYRTFPSYRQALDVQFARTVDAAALINLARPDPRDLVMTTWELSLDALEVRGVPQARPMLRRLSFYAPAVPIPRRLLELGAEIDHVRTAVTGTDARITLEQGLNGLLSLGLVELQPLTSTGGQLPEQGIVLHPLVAETNRAHYAAAAAPSDDDPLLGANLQVAELAGKLQPDDPGYWPHWQFLSPHIGALLPRLPSVTPKVSAAMLDVAGNAVIALFHSGALAEAEQLAYLGLQQARRLDPAHPSITALLHNRALVLAERGNLNEAETEARNALSIERQTPVNDADATLATRKLLASILRQRGYLAEAERECRAVSHAMSSQWGPDDPRTLSSRTDLVLILHQQARFSEAEKEIRSVADAERDAHGEDHPETLAALHNLALVLASRGDLRQAEHLYRTVLEARWQILGGHHPDTLSTWHLHTQTWWRLEAADEAVTEMTRVVENLQEALGEEHPVTMNACQDLTTMLCEQGQLVKAAAQARRLAETSRRIFGEHHPTTLRARSNLGAITFRGRPNRTLADLQSTLSDAQRQLGEEHPATLVIRQNIAVIWLMQNRFRQAEQELRAILEVQRRVLGKYHPDVLNTRLGLATALASLDDARAAGNEARAVLRTARQVLAEDHPLISGARKLLRQIHPDQAE
jgi:tetratricopeptide (TPR) repeat protein